MPLQSKVKATERNRHSGHVASNLAKQRNKLGLSLKDLAEKSGVFWTVIYRIEKQQHRHPRIDTLQKLAKAMGTSVEAIATPMA